jgi:hypothetical protein
LPSTFSLIFDRPSPYRRCCRFAEAVSSLSASSAFFSGEEEEPLSTPTAFSIPTAFSTTDEVLLNVDVNDNDDEDE